MESRNARKNYLRLPPVLDDSLLGNEQGATTPVFPLLPQAVERLSQLCPGSNWKLGNVVGRGECVFVCVCGEV